MTALRAKLESLESLRGVAALMVLLYHLVEIVKIPLPESLSFISTRFGLGVPLFYTLSGFVLMFGYAESLSSKPQIYKYFVRRFFRIAPLFYTMLILWLAVNWVAWDKVFSAKTLLLNFSFLFGFVPGQHESIVWAGWSIGIEMIFYLLFPALVMIFRSLGAALIGFVSACFLSTAAYNAFAAAELGTFAYMNLGTHLPFFMAGIASFKLWEAAKFSRSPVIGWVLLGGFFTFAIVVSSADQVHMILTKFGFELNIWAILFSMLILSACYSHNPILESRPLQHLGKLSYSLYLLHPLVMLGLIELGFSSRIASLTSANFNGFILATLITLYLVWFLSVLSFRFVETPGIELGKRLIYRTRAKVPFTKNIGAG